MSQLSLIDTHAHLNDPKFADDIDEVIARAATSGVSRIIVPGYDLESSRDAAALSARYESVFATVGVHPHDAKNYSDEIEQALAELSHGPNVLAIGEIGLDFHYDFSPRDQQAKVFEAQIDLAGRLKLPIVVHSRESNMEAMEILKGASGKLVGGVFHFFSGDMEFAKNVLDFGLYIGVDGPLTYKSSEELRGVVKECPLDRLLIETDCPYLSPIPHRGKRNEPAYVTCVAEMVARVRGITIEEVAEATSANARMLFGERL